MYCIQLSLTFLPLQNMTIEKVFFSPRMISFQQQNKIITSISDKVVLRYFSLFNYLFRISRRWSQVFEASKLFYVEINLQDKESFHYYLKLNWRFIQTNTVYTILDNILSRQVDRHSPSNCRSVVIVEQAECLSVSKIEIGIWCILKYNCIKNKFKIRSYRTLVLLFRAIF